MSGCFRSYFGVIHHPERQHYSLFEEHYGVKASVVKHVKVTSKGHSIFWIFVSDPDTRAIIEREMKDHPNDYVGNLMIHTDTHRTTPIIMPIVVLPRLDIEFDIIKLEAEESTITSER